jgi:hypothetical protein
MWQALLGERTAACSPEEHHRHTYHRLSDQRRASDESRCHLCSRVSTAQQEKQGTIESQLAVLEEYAAEHELVISPEITATSTTATVARGWTGQPWRSCATRPGAQSWMRSWCSPRIGWRVTTPTSTWCSRNWRSADAKWCLPTGRSTTLPRRGSGKGSARAVRRIRAGGYCRAWPAG